MSDKELIAEIRDLHERQDRREGEPPMCLACSPVDWPCDAARAADALEAATRERDAARAEIESRIEDRDYWYGIANIAKGQRDAATAALERVRAIHLEVGRQVDDAGVEYTVCKHCTEVNRYGQVRWPCRTIQALDGAPEPEREWGYAGETLVGVHNSISREAAEEDVASLRRYWNDERKFWVVRRTPASEWLPVEGEKP